MNRYLILPNCCDTNRGDQSLVWESIRLAKDAGFEGKYSILSAEKDLEQSKSVGLKVIEPILLHPSRKTKRKNNIGYDLLLKAGWGCTAVLDFITSLYVLAVCGFHCWKRWLPRRYHQTIEAFRDCNAVFVKGGGFLHSHGGITAWYYIYYQIYHIVLAQKLNKKVYIFPNSIGPVNELFDKSMIKHIFKSAELIYCRENISKYYISGKFPQFVYQVSFDLGFYLQSDQQFGADAYLNQALNGRTPDNCVAITVRPYRFPEYKNGAQMYQNYINSLALFSRYVYQIGYFPVFVQHTLSEFEHENDLVSIKEIIALLQEGEYAVIADKNLNCRQLKALYSRFFCLIGTRFHSVIFAMSEDIPSIAIAYGGNKTIGVMQDIGLKDYAIKPMEMSEIKLIDTFNKLLKNYEDLKRSLRHINEIAFEERGKIIEQIRFKNSKSPLTYLDDFSQRME